LDEEYENLGWEVKDNVKMKPSEYFRRQCYISIEPSEAYLSEIIQYIGEDNLLFGSDYPHIDHNPEILEKMVGLQEQLSKKTVQKILWDNPMRFYGIN
jgi:predicted TIM-barrel fold metal-dependent hydrolase